MTYPTTRDRLEKRYRQKELHQWASLVFFILLLFSILWGVGALLVVGFFILLNTIAKLLNDEVIKKLQHRIRLEHYYEHG